MSTKGMSVIAARALVDRLSAAGVKILVAHDLDMAGIRIFGTLGSDSSRYRFTHSPDIRRLGLTLDQARGMDLQSERQDVHGDRERILRGLREYGVGEDELAFIDSGQRVELNAMTSDQFIAWIERGLRLNGIKKIVPPSATIEQRARHIVAIRELKSAIAGLERDARQRAAEIKLPADLAERMQARFAVDPSVPWEDSLDAVLREWLEQDGPR